MLTVDSFEVASTLVRRGFVLLRTKLDVLFRVARPDATEVDESHVQQCGLDVRNCGFARIAIPIISLCLSTVHASTVRVA
jgi:hypothetical protein